MWCSAVMSAALPKNPALARFSQRSAVGRVKNDDSRPLE